MTDMTTVHVKVNLGDDTELKHVCFMKGPVECSPAVANIIPKEALLGKFASFLKLDIEFEYFSPKANKALGYVDKALQAYCEGKKRLM